MTTYQTIEAGMCVWGGEALSPGLWKMRMLGNDSELSDPVTVRVEECESGGGLLVRLPSGFVHWANTFETFYRFQLVRGGVQ